MLSCRQIACAVPNGISRCRGTVTGRSASVTGWSSPRPPGAKYPVRMDLHVVFEPDEQGWVRATIEELPGVITCAPTIEEARDLVRDALDEWLAALTSEERASIGPDATRETLTLSVA